MSKLNKLSSIKISESILSRSNTNFNPYLSEKLNNLSQLIISMTETIFARRSICAEIISNIGKYTLGIAEFGKASSILLPCIINMHFLRCSVVSKIFN